MYCKDSKTGVDLFTERGKHNSILNDEEKVMTKNTNKKVSAIDAIIHPFQFESKSTQTESKPKQINLGGRSVTKMVYNEDRKQWESVTTVEGGVDVVVTHRIRTGKTAREKVGKKVEKPVVEQKKGKKK